VSGTSVCRVQVCVGCKCVSGASVLGCMCVSGACVCWVQVCVGCKCVGVHVCVGCICVSGASVCRVQVCVGYICVSDTSVCRGKVCVGDKSSRGHVSLNRLANPGKVSMDSNSLAKIKNVILNTLPRKLAP
jgi:hypothetical protein